MLAFWFMVAKGRGIAHSAFHMPGARIIARDRFARVRGAMPRPYLKSIRNLCQVQSDNDCGKSEISPRTRGSSK